MSLQDTQNHWNQLGKDDPFWAVLTDPTKQGGRWDPSEFFQTGVDEIATVMKEMARLKVSIHRKNALDFGCGVGRLSQALATHFDEVHGIDISPSMIGHANRLNQHAGKCHYHLNSSSDLKLFPDNQFDFVYSVIALQHIETRYQKDYLAEFFRVLKPNGVAVFQIICARGWRRFLPAAGVAAYRKIRHRGNAFISMFGVPEAEMDRTLTEGGMKTLDIRRSVDDTGRWSCLRYFTQKPS